MGLLYGFYIGTIVKKSSEWVFENEGV